MAYHWLLPASVLVGSVLIALAIISPMIFAQDVGIKARRECAAFVREGMPDTNQSEQLVQVCVFRRTGLGG